MVSLWGSKDKDAKANGAGRDDSSSQRGEGSHAGHGRESHETDERTRLLPPSNSGYLDPDDPAVSPQPTTLYPI